MGTYFKTIRTMEGKYVTQVRTSTNGTEVAHYESPEYLTYFMASADAKCWKEFHMVEKEVELTEWEKETLELADHNQPTRDVTSDEAASQEGEEDYTINANDKVYGRSGVCKTGEEFAAHLARVMERNPDVTFRIYPFSASEKRGFHLDVVYPGNAPTRKFTVHKA